MGFARLEIVFYGRDKVEIIKTFEGYAKSFGRGANTVFFTTLHINVQHKSKLNRNLSR